MRNFEAGLGKIRVRNPVLPLGEQGHQFFGFGVGGFEVGLQLHDVNRKCLNLVAQVQLFVIIPQLAHRDVGDAGRKHVLRFLGSKLPPQRGKQAVDADYSAPFDPFFHGLFGESQKVSFLHAVAA